MEELPSGLYALTPCAGKMPFRIPFLLSIWMRSVADRPAMHRTSGRLALNTFSTDEETEWNGRCRSRPSESPSRFQTVSFATLTPLCAVQTKTSSFSPVRA